MESAGFYIAEAGEEEVSPSPAPHSLTGMQREEKVSGITRLFSMVGHP